MKFLKQVWRMIVPFRLRASLSERRNRSSAGNGGTQAEIDELRREIDELRGDQLKIAQLMDFVEQLAIKVELKSVEQEKPE